MYVLNKSDLVDVAEIKLNLELNEIKPYIFFSAKNKNGLSDLKEIIRKMSNNLDTDAMNVGIIGYPNTGKSSIINILTGRAATKTSSQAGFTKGLQKIRIFPGVYLMDTPGIIPLKEDSTKNRRDLIKHAEIGVRTWDKTKNPDMVVHKIMQEYPGILEKYYKIKAGGDSEILIEGLGRKHNYLIKGNIVDEDRTARHVLRDWQEGRIRINKF